MKYKMPIHNNHQAMQYPSGDTPRSGVPSVPEFRVLGCSQLLTSHPPSLFSQELCHHCLHWLTHFPCWCFINTLGNDGVCLGAGHFSVMPCHNTGEAQAHPNPPQSSTSLQRFPSSSQNSCTIRNSAWNSCTAQQNSRTCNFPTYWCYFYV